MQPAPQDNQLMSKHHVLSFKPQLRLEGRGQYGQNETEQPDHSASLGDSITSSTRIRFSVRTAFFDPLAKVHVGLGAIEVVGGNGDGIACSHLRNRLRLGERGKADGGKQHASNFSKWNADRTALDLKDFGAPTLIHYPSFYRAHDPLPPSIIAQL